MIRIGILGAIGSGKSFVAKSFGFPVFNADLEVAKLYQKDKKIFNKLNRELPRHIHSFPVQKKEILNAILANKNNLNKIIKIVHLEIKKKMKVFLEKHNKSKIVILDIPLLLENKINKKKDILVYVNSNNSNLLKRLKKRKNFNQLILNKFNEIQLSTVYKRKKAHYVINNKFTKKSVKDGIKNIINQIL